MTQSNELDTGRGGWPWQSSKWWPASATRTRERVTNSTWSVAYMATSSRSITY